jgi:putative nucleotidyltransferase with HDIG domain
MSPTLTDAARARALVRELERMPAQPTAATRVLWLTSDPNSSSNDLAAAVSADPSLTSKIMRLANSAYYGVSGRVRSCAFAVTMVGFSTVRSMAATAAAGALDEDATLPEGFWSHAASVATAAGLVAPRVGARHPEAFSLGLLHDLGSFLLHRTDTEAYAAMLAELDSESPELLLAERKTFGIDHAAAAARVLQSWSFPVDFTEALAAHHEDPDLTKSALSRALVGGEALAHVAQTPAKDHDREDVDRAVAAELRDALRLVRVDLDVVSPLAAQVRRGAASLAASLQMD